MHNKSITESQLDDAVHAVAQSLTASGISLGEDSLCYLNETLAAFLTDICAVRITSDEGGNG